MGKRKSKDCDYDNILRKIKKLEYKLKKRKRQSSESTASEDADSPPTPCPVFEYELGEAIPVEVVDMEEYADGTQHPIAQVETSESATGAHAGAGGIPAEPDVQFDLAPQLEPEILNLLGEDPTNEKSFGNNLHKDIAPRWTHILINGLNKETQSELIKSYLPPENCPNMRAPKLNLEIKAALLELNVKKDLYSQSKQNQLASSLAAIGQVLNWALESKSTVPQEIIKTLSDSGRLICDSHYRESQSRRFAALNTLNKDIRDTIKNTKIDEHLFGTDLSEHIKSSKAITKTGSEMKPAARATYKPPALQPQRGALNSRGAPLAAAAEPRSTPAPRRPPRDRRQDAARGRRSTGYSRHQTRRR